MSIAEAQAPGQPPKPPDPFTVKWRVVLALAGRGWPVVPCHAAPGGRCTCGKPDCGSPGKHPIGKLAPNGVKSATTDRKQLFDWFSQRPDANVGIDVGRSGLLVVDPDSDAAQIEVDELGRPRTIQRHSRQVADVYRRPEGCPATTATHRGASGKIDMLSSGVLIVHGQHANGSPIWLDEGDPTPTPKWAADLLLDKPASTAPLADDEGDEPPIRLSDVGLALWRGERSIPRGDGQPDRSETLYALAGELARAGATGSGIRAWLRDRDVALGYRKYSERPDGGAEDYAVIARKVLEREAAREIAESVPLTRPTPPDEGGRVNGDGLTILILAVLARNADLERTARLRELELRIGRNSEVKTIRESVKLAAYHYDQAVYSGKIARGDGLKVYLPELAVCLGRGIDPGDEDSRKCADSISAHLTRYALTDHFDYWSAAPRDPISGVTIGPTRSYIRFKGVSLFADLRALADVEDLPTTAKHPNKWGGLRTCPSCHGHNVVSVCRDCGAIFDERPNLAPEQELSERPYPQDGGSPPAADAAEDPPPSDGGTTTCGEISVRQPARCPCGAAAVPGSAFCQVHDYGQEAVT